MSGLLNRDPYTFANQDSAPKAAVDVALKILKSWDIVDTDFDYVNAFTPDGILHVAPKPSQGRQALMQLHSDMINGTSGPVIDLQHYVDRFFFNEKRGTNDKPEFIFTGKLTNVLKNGQRITTDFASFAILTKAEDGSDDEFKVEYFRVFSDTSELMAAIEKMETGT